MNVGFVSLGCNKNLVDTEMCIGIFKKEKFNIVNNPQNAEIIVVNTCGFIEPAKEEAINTILEMSQYKKTGICKYLIVMGCLVERYEKELKKAIPEVDLFIPISEYENLWKKISLLISAEFEESNKLDYLNRVITTGNSMAYLRIADGCNNRCTYCAIPYIRGPFVSRKIDDVLEEAKLLSQRGITELIVVAQDTTKYGVDIYGKEMLPELLEKLCKIDGFKWIRFLYAYPESISDELIRVVKENDKICKYFDIPLQHYSNSVLKRMNRKSDSESIKNTILKIKSEIPNVILRTTMIVGFPGETEEDFNILYDFVNEVKFDKLGAFKYSKEEGTPAYKMKNQIHFQTKNRRYKKLMSLQNKISKEKLLEKIGNTYEVVIDDFTKDNKFIVARSYMDIPNEDGVIFIENTKSCQVGEYVKCTITDVKDYDLIGKLV